ncbi:MAG: transposase [SAR324 cluster bacterium]|nr:transposase [SAR324 cluster bacterium]
MNTELFIIELFDRVDNSMKDVKKHSQSSLYPSEIATLALLFSIKGVGGRAFYRWLKCGWLQLFTRLPSRTRLLRLFKTHRHWADHFLADPTIISVVDTYGVELIHPIREGRSDQQIGKNGISNQRWIVGCKLCLILNKFGLVVDWDCDTANVHDNTFQYMIEPFIDKMILFADSGFHAKNGDPENLKICKKGEWNDRMLVETVLSMLTVISHFKKMTHRKWDYLKSRIAYYMASFNILTQWFGLPADDNGFVPLSIKEFSL